MQANNPSGSQGPATLMHRLDPRTKLGLLLVSFIMVLLPQRPEVVAVATLLVLGHLSLARAWRLLWPVRWLLFALALFSLGLWSWMAQGPTPLVWRISRESLAFGAANFLKLGTMMVAGLILLATTPVEELFLGLVKLRLPYPGAFAFALALRWVPEVFATAVRVREAQEVRGLAWEGGGRGGRGGVLTRLRRYLPLLVPIFLLTLRRSQAMSWALEARGFQRSRVRTYFLEIHPTARDWLVLALAALFLSFFILLHLWRLDGIPGLTL